MAVHVSHQADLDPAAAFQVELNDSLRDRRGHRRHRNGRVSWPYYRWRLKAEKPIRGYPRRLEHIGHHVLKRRLDLGLKQKQAAEILGTGVCNLRNWETGRHPIRMRFYPAIIRFLGYNVLPPGATRGQKVRRERLSRGWSCRWLGHLAKVDQATVWRIEADKRGLASKPLERVLAALDLTEPRQPARTSGETRES
jgi:transcriptional regulator with XRE-family HTH domain